jgi:hypothetical protein
MAAFACYARLIATIVATIIATIIATAYRQPSNMDQH